MVVCIDDKDEQSEEIGGFWSLHVQGEPEGIEASNNELIDTAHKEILYGCEICSNVFKCN